MLLILQIGKEFIVLDTRNGELFSRIKDEHRRIEISIPKQLCLGVFQ